MEATVVKIELLLSWLLTRGRDDSGARGQDGLIEATVVEI